LFSQHPPVQLPRKNSVVYIFYKVQVTYVYLLLCINQKRPIVNNNPVKIGHPKLFSISIPDKVRDKTTTPAVNIPKQITIKERRTGRSKTKATKEAVHPPVIGKGMAVKKNKAQTPLLNTLSVCLFLVYLNNQLKIGFNNLNLETGSNKRKIKRTAVILPNTATKKACHQTRL